MGEVPLWCRCVRRGGGRERVGILALARSRGGEGELEDAVDPLPCVRRLRLTMGIGVCFFSFSGLLFFCRGLLFFSGLLIFHGLKKGDAFRCVPNSCRTHLGSSLRWREGAYRGISLIRNSPPPGTTIGP